MNRTIRSLLTIRTSLLSFYFPKSLHSSPNSNTRIITNLCNSLRKNTNWSTLTKTFPSLTSLDTNSIIEQVLLELQHPKDAKHALSFFHWSAQHPKKPEKKHCLYHYCITIHILVRAKMFIDAKALLESVVRKHDLGVVEDLIRSYQVVASGPFVFDLLVQVYAKLRMFDAVLIVCDCLDDEGFCLRLESYNLLIRVCVKSDRNLLVWKVFERMIQRRICPNDKTVKFMIDGLCKEGTLQCSVEMLDRINNHGRRCSPMVIVNASLVYRIIEEGRVDDGILLLKRMLQKNMILDTVAFSLIVYGKIKNGDLDVAWEVYEEMLKRGFQANSFVYTSFVGAYSRNERIEQAIKLMEEMEELGINPYNETFNHIIEGCAKVGRFVESLRFCKIMVERGLVPTLLAFNEMVKKLSVIKDIDQANGLLTLVLDKGFLPDETTYSHLIAAYGRACKIEESLKLYHEMEYRSLSPGLNTFSSLIKSFCHCGKLGEAEKYLKVMKDRSLAPSVCVYETLIACNFEKGDKSRALELDNEMVYEGLKPTFSYTF